MMFTRIADLSPDVQEKALASFGTLARAQRGKPERMGGAVRFNVPIFHATGLWTWMSEHVGDLTHRMAESHCEKWSYGFGPVTEKIDRAFRYLSSGFADAVETNIKNNYEDAVEHNGLTQAFDEYVEEFKAGARLYADAHRELVVYNPAQYHAKQAAVALGMLYYSKMIQHLSELKAHLDDPGMWSDYASLVDMSGGEARPYNGEPFTIYDTNDDMTNSVTEALRRVVTLASR